MVFIHRQFVKKNHQLQHLVSYTFITSSLQIIPVVLVRRDYKCFKKQHEVVSYHPGILRQMNAPSLILFRLWSRTGFALSFSSKHHSNSVGYLLTELVQAYTLAGLFGLSSRRVYDIASTFWRALVVLLFHLSKPNFY